MRPRSDLGAQSWQLWHQLGLSQTCSRADLSSPGREQWVRAQRGCTGTVCGRPSWAQRSLTSQTKGQKSWHLGTVPEVRKAVRQPPRGWSWLNSVFRSLWTHLWAAPKPCRGASTSLFPKLMEGHVYKLVKQITKRVTLKQLTQYKLVFLL